MWKQPLICGSLFILLTGCRVSGSHPQQQVQFCLTEEQNGDELRRTLQQVAQEHQMRFTDRSEDTENELRSFPDLLPEVRRSFPIINVSVSRPDGLGVGGGNSGLPANQIGLGFTAGADSGQTRVFTQDVLARLERKWDVFPAQGLVPLKHCSRQDNVPNV